MNKKILKLIIKIIPSSKIRKRIRSRINKKSSGSITSQFTPSYEDRKYFGENTSEVKAICFHLPQYHKIKENDYWWGEGFTEWTNVKKSESLYLGHFQPMEPHEDIGYYDLSYPEAIYKQAELLNAHGLHGFCFYYYKWGKTKLLQKPLEIILNNKDIKTNFCLCWANGDWTRTWEGKETEYLVRQSHDEKSDLEFIVDIEKYLRDERYIKIDNKLLIVVFETKLFPDFQKTTEVWRAYTRDKGIGELFIASVAESGNYYETNNTGIDANIEFPPHNMGQIVKDPIFGKHFKGNVFDYSHLVNSVISAKTKVDTIKESKNIFRCAMLKWDNSPRRGERAHIWENFSFKLYQKWIAHLKDQTNETSFTNDRVFFINAWNEWAEGTVLEPDAKNGYSALNRTAEVILNSKINTHSSLTDADIT